MSRPPIHERAMTQRGIRLPDSDWAELRKLAANLSKKSPGTVTPSDLVREAVRRYIRILKRRKATT